MCALFFVAVFRPAEEHGCREDVVPLTVDSISDLLQERYNMSVLAVILFRRD